MTKYNQEARDKFWDTIRDSILSSLERNSRLAYDCCEDIADDVVNDISEDALDSVVDNESSEADVLEFLTHLKSRYYHVLEAPEQRDLDKLLRLFLP